MRHVTYISKNRAHNLLKFSRPIFRFCQEKVWNTIFHFKCLRGQHNTVSQTCCPWADGWVGLVYDEYQRFQYTFPWNRPRRHGGEAQAKLYRLSSLTLDRGECQRPSRNTPGRNSRYAAYRRIAGSRGQSRLVRKISPPPGFEFRIVQPITIRYTDCVSVIDTVFHKRLDSSMSTVSGGPGFNAGKGRRFFSSFTSAKPPVLGVPGALHFLKLNTDHHIHLRGTFKMFPESFYFWDKKTVQSFKPLYLRLYQ